MLRRVHLFFAFPLALLAGFALSVSFPSASLWPMAFIGVALLLWSLIGRKFWISVGLGFVAGAAFWLSLIQWLTLYLGPVPWLALGILQAIFFALGIGVISLVINRGPLRWPGPWGTFVITPVLIAALWATREAVTSVWPYGGFSWGRLAQSQSESPLVHTVSWVGTTGLSFLVALVAALVVQVLRQQRPVTFLVYPLIMLVALMIVPAFPVEISGTTRVLAVQGDSQAGLFDRHPPGTILQDHIAGTLPYAGEDIDMVVWPENASDLDPSRSQVAAASLSYVSEELSAPVVTGTITHPTEEEYFNSSIVWENGAIQAQYDKIRPVPFAEYMPNRSFWRLFAPDLVDLVAADYTAGTRPNVLEVAGVPAGISICFDITDDQQAYDMIAEGAQIILAQTNNADFGQTDENVQQLAIARLRAVETGRSVVNISTVGTSAIISPDGSSLATLVPYEPGEMLEAVPLSTTITPAMTVGRSVEISLAVISFLGLVLVFVRRRTN